MTANLLFSLRRSIWLLALLIITSAIPALAQELDAPFNYEYSDELGGYIISPISDLRYENELFVPAKRESDGLPVVGVDGFSYRPYILAIIFEEGSRVKYIGSFQGCTGIQTIINLPETVETIADYAFYDCSMLSELTLNSNLKYIGISSFENCTSLESITLPESLKVLRERAFRCCTNLKKVVFADKTNFYADDGRYCFYNNVFDGCEELNSVTLPMNAPGDFIIPMQTFSWCGKLKSIEFPTNTIRIEQKAFYFSGIENIDLRQITSQKLYLEGYYTFAKCRSLKSVKANGNLQFGPTSLYTFQWCDSLQTVEISGEGDDFIAITPDAFRYCDNLESVDVYRLKGTGERNEMDSVFVGCKKLKRITSQKPSILSKIGVSCFDGCESLERVDLPVEGTFTISETAFRGCAALQNLDLANVTSIGTKAFTGCGALTSLSIKSKTNDPPTVASEDAFDAWHYANTELEVLDEKYSVFAADEYWKKFVRLKHPSLFAYEEFQGGYSVTKNNYALAEDFTGMLVIPEQYLSKDVIAIKEGAFQGLSGLTGVTFPKTIASIGSKVFDGCTNIATIVNKVIQPIYGDNCPEDVFYSEIYTNGDLSVPFGSLDAYRSYSPWLKFNDRIKQGFGERTLTAPKASHDAGDFNQPFDLTLTDPNEGAGATIYYYIVKDGDGASDVRTVESYSAPIRISSSCKVVAYLSNGTQCCEPISLTFTRTYQSTVNGLDKVLSANAGEEYIINTNLYGLYHDGEYLYASTIGNSGSSKNTFNEDKKTNESSDNESDFNQEDWVAISGLSSDFVGKEIENRGYMATVVLNSAYPVISFDDDVTAVISNMSINKFRVENFNIHAESAAVSDIWLVAPQPAEYCSVKGYLNSANIHEAECYLVLQSRGGSTTEDTAGNEPLTMNVYYNPATTTLSGDGWYSFTGIVSKEGEALKFTALYDGEVSLMNSNAELLSMQAGKLYQVNVSLEGVKENGGVLYARTSGTSAAPSMPAEGHTTFESYEDGDRLELFDQRDWVAIEGLTSDYEGHELGLFVAGYDGEKLTLKDPTPAVGSAVDLTYLNMFNVANVFYGNYENTETLGLENDYRPFFVKAKVNEVARYIGDVIMNADGNYELCGFDVGGKLNDKGLEIDTNGKTITTSTKQIEGVLVADANANGGVKLVAFSGQNTITGVETPAAEDNVAIYGTKGAVVVAGADGKVTIFDAMGRKVKNVSAEGVTTIQMPAGYYIVHTAETAKSVIVM